MHSNGFKKHHYILKYIMNKKDLKKLTKSQLIRLLLKQEKDSINEPIPPPITEQWESVKPKLVPQKSYNEYEDIILPLPEQFRDKYEPIPKPRTDIPLQMKNTRRPPKPQRSPPPPPQQDYPFNFDNDIFQTENKSLGKFKIINVQSTQNKKFKSFTNEFKLKILKNWTVLKRSITYFKD